METGSETGRSELSNRIGRASACGIKRMMTLVLGTENSLQEGETRNRERGKEYIVHEQDLQVLFALLTCI